MIHKGTHHNNDVELEIPLDDPPTCRKTYPSERQPVQRSVISAVMKLTEGESVIGHGLTYKGEEWGIIISTMLNEFNPQESDGLAYYNVEIAVTDPSLMPEVEAEMNKSISWSIGGAISQA